MKNGATQTVDKVKAVVAGLKALVADRVLVGIPSTNAGRQSGPITNAALGYIHENGAPEVGIPARPWLVPGVESAQREIDAGLRRAAEFALAGKPDAVDRQLDRVGLRAASAVKNYLTAGVAPPLADSTLRGRARRGRVGAAQELANRAKGQAPSVDLAKPLIDTGQLRNSVTYVRRKV